MTSSVAETILTTVKNEAKQIVLTVETDLKTAATTISLIFSAEAKVVSTDLHAFFADQGPLITALLPGEYALLKPLVQGAEHDVATGDFADLETAVLNKAAAAGLTFVAGLTSAELTAIMAIIKTGQAPAPAPLATA